MVFLLTERDKRSFYFIFLKTDERRLDKLFGVLSYWIVWLLRSNIIYLGGAASSCDGFIAHIIITSRVGKKKKKI